MSDSRVRCPSCHALLALPEDVRQRWRLLRHDACDTALEYDGTKLCALGEGQFRVWAYARFGLTTSASASELNGALRKRMAEYHPDRILNLAEELQAVARRRAADLTSLRDMLAGQARLRPDAFELHAPEARGDGGAADGGRAESLDAATDPSDVSTRESRPAAPAEPRTDPPGSAGAAPPVIARQRGNRWAAASGIVAAIGGATTLVVAAVITLGLLMSSSRIAPPRPHPPVPLFPAERITDGSMASNLPEQPMDGRNSSLPERPTRDEVLAALLPVQGAVPACSPQAGTARTEITIAGATGRVTNVTVLGEFAGTPVASCVESAVRTARFPRFTQPTFSVIFPFRL